MDPWHTILIVEDSPDCAEALALALIGVRGVRLEVATTAEEALERIETESISAMITDFHLPQMDGIELVRKVSPKTPVIVISGDSDARTPTRAIEAGARAFFSKPYSPAAVRRELEDLLHEGGVHGNGKPD